MILNFLILSMVLIIPSPSSTSAQPNCTRVCAGGRHENQVPYPFGFSDGCEVHLNCSNAGEIRVGQYNVHNITRDHILINFPSKCDRQFNEIRQFNNRNFALTWRNGFLLSNCHWAFYECKVPTIRVGSHLNLQQCDTTGVDTTINCYSNNTPEQEEFINLNSLELPRCQYLVSSALFDVNGNSSHSESGPEFDQYLELGWWVRGECGCDRNAICRNVSYENQTIGYRCYCNQGYVGDGFIDGDGCRIQAQAPGGSNTKPPP
ncbi:hypothetical protein M8C21_024430, partial [Ambrosia artemisiifolia]